MNAKNIFGILLSVLNKQTIDTAKWIIIYRHNPTSLLALLDVKNTICCIEQIDNTLVFDDDGTNFDCLSGDDDKLKTIALDQDLNIEDCHLYVELSKTASKSEIKNTIQAFINAYKTQKEMI